MRALFLRRISSDIRTIEFGSFRADSGSTDQSRPFALHDQ